MTLAALFLAGAAFGDRADKRGRAVDKIWTHPDYATAGIRAIALLPIASFDHNVIAERNVAMGWGQRYQGSGYRWVSAPVATTLLRATVGDSTLDLAEKAILANGRVDSTMAPLLCTKLRTQAVLCLRVDRWEQMEIEFNQRGRPSTTVALSAALVDSAGRLLWTGSGSETAEGPEHDPNANVIGVKSSDLSMKAVGEGGPPAYIDVLTRLLARWGDRFPGKPAAPAEAAPAK